MIVTMDKPSIQISIDREIRKAYQYQIVDTIENQRIFVFIQLK